MASDKMQTTFSGVAQELQRVGQAVDAMPTDVVEYNTSQSLTGPQKEKARANIGAGTSNFSGNYNDLDKKPTLAAVATSGSYNDLNDKVIINQDLSASGFSPVEGKYYLHTGATIISITPLVLNTSPANIYFDTSKTVSEMVAIFEAFRNSATPAEVDSGLALYFFVHNKETPSGSMDPSTDVLLALYYVDSSTAAEVRTDGLSESVYMLCGLDSSTGVVPYFSNANLIREFGSAVTGWNTDNIPATWGVEIKYLQGQTQLDQFASSAPVEGGASFTHGLIYHYINGNYASIDNPALATVAFTGNYNDLKGKPALPESVVDGGTVSLNSLLNDGYVSYTMTSAVYNAFVNDKNKTVLRIKAQGTGTYSGLVYYLDFQLFASSDTSLAFMLAGSDVSAYFDNVFGSQALNRTLYYVQNSGIRKWNDIKNLKPVATSGSYNDLNDKPDLAAVATSGSYNDLNDQPIIPSVGNGTITIQKNGAQVDTFTTNQSSNKSINITIPTFTWDATNHILTINDPS